MPVDTRTDIAAHTRRSVQTGLTRQTASDGVQSRGSGPSESNVVDQRESRVAAAKSHERIAFLIVRVASSRRFIISASRLRSASSSARS